ncbi:armadillo-type protein [Xylogone sp. PMI_703]|nr:armadillo-type protein [Xylogone sp. PMI_703]
MQLRPICIKISQLVLQETTKSNNTEELLESLDSLLELLRRKCQRIDGVFDEKLADYIFFPLAQLLRQKQSFNDRQTELAIQCITVLLEYGWRSRIPPELGKQLLLLLTIVVGGVPGSDQTPNVAEELIAESYRALTALFRDLKSTPSGQASLVEPDTLPSLAHCMTVILDGIMSGQSADVQQRALEALIAGWDCVKDPVALASFLPGTISALTKSLTPTSGARRLRKTIVLGLRALENVLVSMLGDVQTKAYVNKERESDKLPTGNKTKQLLTESWLKATAAQTKLALSNVMRLRTHEASDVRTALNRFCLVLIGECHDSLSESASMLVETAMVMTGTELDKDHDGVDSNLSHLAVAYPDIGQLVQVIIYNWITSLPRIMQGSDEVAKQNLLHHISGSFELLTTLNLDFSILEEALSDSLREGIAVTMKIVPAQKVLQETALVDNDQVIMKLQDDISAPLQSDAILLTSGSQKQTRKDVLTLLSKLPRGVQLSTASQMLSGMHESSGPSLVSAFWLCSELMRSVTRASGDFDDFIDLSVLSTDIQTDLSQDLFSYSVSVISEPEVAEYDWHLQAIALGVISETAQRSKVAFRSELVDVLYPVAQLLGSPYSNLRDHAIRCLNTISFHCGYSSTSELIIDNSDYMVNSISLKLNTFDISPQAPQVLTMLIRLTGPSLLLYLDDVIGSIFAALDNFHGYPRLVDGLFAVLGEVVMIGSKSNLIAPAATRVIESRQSSASVPSVGDIVDIVNKRLSQSTAKDSLKSESAPRMPWKDVKMGNGEDDEHDDEGAEDQVSNEVTGELQKPPPSKVYSMIESIARLSQHYLTNESPFLRTKLLHLISTSCDAMKIDEDRFLPLLNDIWPVVIDRIYDEEPFVVIAGAEAVAKLCTYAGDFLTTRIQVEWPKLIKVAVRLKSNVLMEKKGAGARGNYSQNSQMWASVVELMTSIAQHVRISDDIFDEILELLGSLLTANTDVQNALSQTNADAVWLLQYLQGNIPTPDTPALEKYQFLRLQESGLCG